MWKLLLPALYFRPQKSDTGYKLKLEPVPMEPFVELTHAHEFKAKVIKVISAVIDVKLDPIYGVYLHLEDVKFKSISLSQNVREPTKVNDFLTPVASIGRLYMCCFRTLELF